MRLIIKGIEYTHDTKPLLIGVSYHFKNTKIVSILGNSGCGKSTLLNLIAGLLTPISGEIEVVGSLSYLTQSTTLLPYRTAFENCLLACELRGELSDDKISKASYLFKDFNIDDSAKEKFPHELSGGMRQRVGLIQTLLVDADLYLLDEPFNAIDSTTSNIIQRNIWDNLKRDDSSAIIVTHDIKQAVLMSDGIVIMSNKSQGLEQIDFDEEFTRLSPDQRLGSNHYNGYMLQIIEKLG